MQHPRTLVRRFVPPVDKNRYNAPNSIAASTRPTKNGSVSPRPPHTPHTPSPPSRSPGTKTNIPELTQPGAESLRSDVESTGFGERFRFVVAISFTLLYLGLLAVMFYMGINTLVPNVGLYARGTSSGQAIVDRVVPMGVSFDKGVDSDDVILTRDGAPLELKPDEVISLAGSSVVRLHSLGSDKDIVVDVTELSVGNPLQRWAYALLGLIFIAVGGPVFVKARQRTAASAFYILCVSTAIALAMASVPNLNEEWTLALSALSVLTFGGAFAFFFFNFPVRVGKTDNQRVLMLASLIGVGALLGAGYVWAFMGHMEVFGPVRALAFLYLASCLAAGLLSLGRGLSREHSAEGRQLIALLLGSTAFAVGPGLLLTVLPTLIWSTAIVPMELAGLALGIMPLAFAYAITQHQLLGVRSLVKRSVVYIIMGSSVLLVFSLSAAALRTFLPDIWEGRNSEIGLLGFGLFVFLIAMSYSYLQDRVERLIDRYIYHDAYDYKEALLQFSSQLASEQKLQTLAEQLVERTCRLMNLACGVLLLVGDPNASNDQSKGHKYGDDSPLLLLGGEGELGVDAYESATAFLHAYDNQEMFSPESSEQNTVHFEIYAEYGSCADQLIGKLQDELSTLGIGIDQTGGTIFSGIPEIRSTAAQAMGSSNLCETNSVRKVTSIADAAVATEVSEITKETAWASTMNDFDLDMVRSFLGVPLWTRSRFVGMLCLAGKKTGERFSKDDLSLLSTLGSQAALAIYNAQLHEAREQALLDTISALAHAIEAKDGYTSRHCENMTERAVAVAQAMDLPKQEVENVRLGAILHDIGKIGVADAVLNKPGKLTFEEYEEIKKHAEKGARIVRSVAALQGVVPIVLHHQERYDGSGYPVGLAGKAIPIGARIIGVVDTYGAMTEDRVYRKAPGHNKAVAELQRFAGVQFDPDVVEAFVRLLEMHRELAEPEPEEVETLQTAQA